MNYNIELNGEIGIDACSFESVAEKMETLKGKAINVRINSPGGYASDGFKIMQLFRDHGQVTCYLEGLVASAATIISMGAAKVIISPYTQYLIHQSSSPVVTFEMMNQEQITAYIKELKKQQTFNQTLDQMCAQLYADRSGKSVEEMAKLMQKAEWLTAEKVIELGLADELGEKVGKPTKLTTELKAQLNAMNLPIPSVLEDDLDPNLIQRIAYAVAKIFNPAPQVPVVNEEPQTIQSKMNNKYEAVMSILAVDGIEEVEDKLTLSAEQMDAINTRLNAVDALKADLEAKDNTISEKDAQIAELNAQIEALKVKPAESTLEVVQEPKDADLTEDKARLMAAQFVAACNNK